MIVALALACAGPPTASPEPVFVAAAAPALPAPGSLGLGTPATAEQIAAWDQDVSPSGPWPPGSGDAATGRAIYATKCASCHGEELEGRSAPRLSEPGVFEVGASHRSIRRSWPYTSTVFDYLRRTMPLTQPGSLTDDEAYALCAFLLAESGVVGGSFVADATTLPAVVMPASRRLAADQREAR
jgi:cytochrome c